MTIANLLISVMLFFSCGKEKSKTDTLNHLLTKVRLESNFIKLIPSVGIVLNSDSILIRKNCLGDLQKMVDNNSLTCKLTVNSPKQLTMVTMDSPPPGFTGEYKHRPDEYITDYSATLQVDSLTFCFYYSKKGQDVLSEDIYSDRLKINSIIISKPMNAGLFEDLKIGDSYEQIFKHFKKPEYLTQLDITRKEIRYTGIVFTIETDKSQVENYGRIIKLEINNLMVY